MGKVKCIKSGYVEYRIYFLNDAKLS